jgi:sulfur transfer protein SufE
MNTLKSKGERRLPCFVPREGEKEELVSLFQRTTTWEDRYQRRIKEGPGRRRENTTHQYLVE